MYAMQTIALCIEYDGTNYSGWQKQKNAVSVQQKLEESVAAILGTDLPVVGGGRTDTGVHARGQVAHIRLDKTCTIPEENLKRAINSKLPLDIRISGLTILESKFHARFDAIAREYSYTIALNKTVFNRLYAYHPGYKYNNELLIDSASVFVGEHDFSTFSKNNPDTKSYICNVKICRWTKSGDYLRLKIKADRFVYGMVRSLTGAMLDIARGKRTTGEVEVALNKADRRLISPIAPPNGLVLEKIYYPAKYKIFL
jgi:tRNA pseudouridine38-40 synthase